MKKNSFRFAVTGVLAVMMAAPVAYSAESEPELTMDQIVEANNKETLLERYGSYLMVFGDGSGDDLQSYSDKEMDCWIWQEEDGELPEIYMDDYVFCICDGVYLYADEEQIEANRESFDGLLFDDLTRKEIIEEYSEEGNTIKVTASISAEDTKEFMEAQDLEYEDGEELLICYTLDADTTAVLEMEEYFRYPDGTTEFSAKVTMTYGAGRPESVDEEYRRVTEDPKRTVTVTLDPDTEEEKTYSVTLTAGIAVGPVLPEGYDTFYLDRACTEVYGGEPDTSKDICLYSIISADDSVSVLEGDFTGWADGHTVEVIVEDGPLAFQVEDEEVKAILEGFEEGTSFTFEAEQTDEVRKITKILGQ